MEETAAQQEEGVMGKKKRKKKKKKAKGASENAESESEEPLIHQEPPKFEVKIYIFSFHPHSIPYYVYIIH